MGGVITGQMHLRLKTVVAIVGEYSFEVKTGLQIIKNESHFRGKTRHPKQIKIRFVDK